MMSSLFWYRPLFMIELLVAELMFSCRLKKRSRCLLRLIISVAVCLLASFVFPVFYNSLWLSLTFLFLFVVSFIAMKFCYDESWIIIFFCAVAAYTTQHFAYEVANFILQFLEGGEFWTYNVYSSEILSSSVFTLENLFFGLIYTLVYFVLYSLIYFIFARRIVKGEQLKLKSSSLIFLVGVGLLVNILLNSFIVYMDESMSVGLNLIYTVYSCLCCFFLLLFQFSLINTSRLQSEIDVINLLWMQEKKQYTISKENMELINMKYHDLKYQIHEIGKSNNISSDAISDIEKAISVYDAAVKTGNDVLDIILTEKSLQCLREGIKLSCIADGERLGFMSETDVYSLFGNALDNAIDAVLKLEEELRAINVTVRGIGDMTSIVVSNCHSGDIKFGADGLPLTSKNDKTMHGFGVKCIRHVVDKYSGQLNFADKNGVFDLMILFPEKMKKGEQK